MRIAFVAFGFAPERTSGLAVGSERVVRSLLDAGHHVTLLAAGNPRLVEPFTHPALTIQRIAVGRSDWIGYARRVASELRRLERVRRFDVVHFAEVHFAYAYCGDYVAHLHHSFRQRAQIVNPLRKPQARLYYALARRLAEQPAARRAKGLLAVSASARHEFSTAYQIDEARIALAPYGTDTERFRAREPDESLRRQLGLLPDQPVLLFVGFVTPRKGLDYLAQALPLIKPAPRLVLAGRWSDAYRARFFELAGAASAQVVEAGYVPDEQLPLYYNLADVYVSPSLMEGFGLPLAEALASEVPVVAAVGGSVAEVVGPGGILVPPADSEALARAISSLLRDSQRRYAFGAQGRAHIERDFSLAAMQEKTLAAYARFLGV